MKTIINFLQTQQRAVLFTAVAFLLMGLTLTAISVVVPSLRAPFEVIFGIMGLALCILLMRLPVGSSQLSQRQWLYLVGGLSLIFQLARWLADGGGIAERTGDDDQIYVLLAQQIVGLLEGPAAFTFRPPGLPSLLAISMWLGGGSSLWLFALIQRLMLATIPLILFLILRPQLSNSVAACASLLFALTEINEIYPTLALTEITYVFGSVLVIWLLVTYLNASNWWWLLGAAVVLALRIMLRPTGITSTLAICLALALSVEGWRWKFASSALLIIPSVLAAFSIMQLNRAVVGRAIISDLSGLNIILHVGTRVAPLEESKAKQYFEDRLPEATSDEVLAFPDDVYIVRHRAALEGQSASTAYTQQSETLARQIIRHHPDVYAAVVLRRTVAGLLYPREELYPIRWIIDQNTFPSREYTEPEIECREQIAVTPELFDTICGAADIARAQTTFKPAWLNLPQPIDMVLHAATISLHYRLRLLIWPFTWGLLAVPCMLYLIFKTQLWRQGLIIAGLFCADFLPTVLYVPIDSRYQLTYIPLFLLAIWWALSEIINSPDAALKSQ